MMKLALGTVQFGIPYGINNQTGVPDDSSLTEILDLAYDSGIRILDTAIAYGNSEERIAGLSKSKFKIVSKFSDVQNKIEFQNSLEASLRKINTDCLYGYISHNANNLIQFPRIWEELVSSRDKEKKIGKIGYSLYNTEQLDQLLNMGFIPDLVQLPYSLLDRKFESYLPELKRMNVEIHIRSVFLQGLYFMHPDQLPIRLLPLKSTLTYLNNLCEHFGTSIGGLALNYVYINPNVDFIVIGVDSQFQLAQNLNIIKKDLNYQIINLVDEISISNPELLNPGNWKN
jgi:aryl-alcohol dehydrogenase-like predicted oxidoreductase